MFAGMHDFAYLGIAVFMDCYLNISYNFKQGARGSVVGRGAIPQAGRSPVGALVEVNIFQFTQSFQPHYGPEVDSSLTEMTTSNLPGG
jgi:hypothetical protein